MEKKNFVSFALLNSFLLIVVDSFKTQFVYIQESFISAKIMKHFWLYNNWVICFLRVISLIQLNPFSYINLWAFRDLCFKKETNFPFLNWRPLDFAFWFVFCVLIFDDISCFYFLKFTFNQLLFSIWLSHLFSLFCLVHLVFLRLLIAFEQILLLKIKSMFFLK